MTDHIKGARRRFLRGSALAPFVLTVPSGSALARSSAAARCAIADDAAADPAFWTTAASETPNWLRKDVVTERVWAIKSAGTCSSTLDAQIVAGGSNSNNNNYPHDAYSLNSPIGSTTAAGARPNVKPLSSYSSGAGADADAGTYYYRLDDPASGTFTRRTGAPSVPATGPTSNMKICPVEVSATPQKMLVRIDTSTGAVRNYSFVSPVSGSYKKVTQSCWTSFV